MSEPFELAQTLIDQQRQIHPDGVELATLVSVAVHIESELLRAVRLRCAPHLDAGAEADLWFSPLMESRGPGGIAFYPEVMLVLRRALGERLRQEHCTHPVHHIGEIIQQLHVHISPALALEERIAWLAVSRGEAALPDIEDELGRAVAALVTQQRTGIADWLRGAWYRLPFVARESATGWMLSQAAGLHRGPEPVQHIAAPKGLHGLDLSAIVAGLPDIQLPVRRDHEQLELGEISGEGAVAVLVPDTDPRLLEARWQENGKPVSLEIEIRPGEHVSHAIGPRAVQLRTARGAVYQIPERTGVTRATGSELGAVWDGKGTTFNLFSRHAEKVELALFNADGKEERIALNKASAETWSIYIPGIGPGQRYGFRVHGPYEPQAGHRFNPAKLLLDPYAKAIDGTVQWSDALFGYQIGQADEDLSQSDQDSAPGMPKCVVVDTSFDWGEDRRLRVPWNETIIYEVHVKGFTQRHPNVPEQLRGTYAGLANPAVIDHLRSLGITAVELLPVHQLVDEWYLVERGLTNYWGYNSIGYFAPEARYSSGGTLGEQVTEFKTMVKALHTAGLEVILDVVYDHTAEGNHLGPTLCFRGIDNAAYYRLVTDDPRYYMDYTGCGNTLNMMHPRSLQLIMDSLRYWILEMHVDGFRFDLASTLARELHSVNFQGAFFAIIQQDPVISQVKLIAEPWDVGEGGYQVGNFPPGWAEWNIRYRDSVRDYWRGEDRPLGELAYRLIGSPDLYEASGRQPQASINFITAHDGFTLNDLVSYNDKHNEANLEDNRDGESFNRSWNCGVEGSTEDPEILVLRARQKRNFLATLMLSQGVPMLLAGDEIGRTQHGNNNAYCQDNEISWMNWESGDNEKELLSFVQRLIQLRKQYPTFRRQHFFQGTETRDIIWLNRDGKEMNDEEWNQPFAHCLGVFLADTALGERDEHRRPNTNDHFLLLLNAHHEEMGFVIPIFRDYSHKRWDVVLDTSREPSFVNDISYPAGEPYPLRGRSLALLKFPRSVEPSVSPLRNA